jgi:hypothetical protein
MGSKKRETVGPGNEDQRERRPPTVTDFDPGCWLISSRTVSEDDRNLPVGNDMEPG